MQPQLDLFDDHAAERSRGIPFIQAPVSRVVFVPCVV